MKKRVKILNIISVFVLFIFIEGFVGCSTDIADDVVMEEEGIGDNMSDTDDIDDSSNDDNDSASDDDTVTELHAAFAAFNTDAVTVMLDGSNVVIETIGLPNHETVYWGEGNELYRDEPDVALTPTIISDNNNAFEMIIDATPDLDGATVQTDLGTIGIAVSGSSIFNDQEGAGALDEAAASLDWTGAHIGPGVYHYHLEPVAFSDDDAELVGVLLDGVFIYGRKCDSKDDYPTDLDASGGHTSTTQYTDGEEEYHYHIINEIYSTTGSYIAFAGPYQGY